MPVVSQQVVQRTPPKIRLINSGSLQIRLRDRVLSLLHEEVTRKIIGAALEVHRALGCGFLEPVYQEAFEIELNIRRVPFVAQPELEIGYKGQVLKQKYKPDVIVERRVIVELKALTKLTTLEEAQAINYLRASRLDVALIMNFGARSLEWKRFILTKR